MNQLPTIPPASSMASFPDENLPEGSVVHGGSLKGATTFDADFVVVGSGAAGAVSAHRLTELGFSVLIVEEGPWVRTREFSRDVGGTFERLMRDNGMQVLSGRAFMPMLQGRCVGGSTVINSAIAWRIPEDVIDSWGKDFGLGESVTMKTLEPHYDVLERDLNVRAVEDNALGENNREFMKQAEALGLKARRMQRYERDCKGSGRCLQGCPTAAKQGMNVTYVPWALRKGARIVTECRVERVEVRGERAVGVLGRTKSNVPVELRARFGVIVGASTVQSPGILRRSGIRSRANGRHFQAHPGQGMGAIFKKRIDMNFGATQGAESISFRSSHRIKLEALSMPPELATARIPGIGDEFAGRLARIDHLGVWVVQFRSDAEGVVKPGVFGEQVTFSPSARDMDSTRFACAKVARMMFEGGAEEIWPGIYGLPAVLTNVDQVKLIEEGPTDPRAYSMVATHMFGATRMGPDARTSVVSPDFESHEVKGLYVVDSGVFPTNLGVNPQHGIMAMSRLATTRLAERASKFVAA